MTSEEGSAMTVVGSHGAPWWTSFSPAPPLLASGHCLHQPLALQVAAWCGGVKSGPPSLSATPRNRC